MKSGRIGNNLRSDLYMNKGAIALLFFILYTLLFQSRRSFLVCIIAALRSSSLFRCCSSIFYSIRAPTVAVVHETKHFQTVSTDTELSAEIWDY